jgi:predicted CXXCH cytochrome family protein
MSDGRCTNCGEPATDTYDLLVRSRNHEEVPLCAACHEAIRAELED